MFHEGRRRSSHRRKDYQLCRQAFQVFSLLLDQLELPEWAEDLHLVEVTPAPDASRLRVAVGVYRTLPMEEALAMVKLLSAHSGRFRWELGQAISRKRVPELLFDLALGEAEP